MKRLRRLRLVTPLAVLAVGLASLGACSPGASPEDYCPVLRQERSTLHDLGDAARSQDPSYLTETLDVFELLRKASPDELRDEWDTVTFAWADLVDVVHDTGLDLAGFDPGKRPAGMSRRDFERVRSTAVELGSLRVRDALTGITQHAREVCGVDLDA